MGTCFCDDMTLTTTQKAAIEDIIHILCTTTAIRGKRQIAGMFLELVDGTDRPQYFEVIPEPRCLNNIRSSLEKNRYKDALDVYTDLSLVFWNAMYYNEPDSQISHDAGTLKVRIIAYTLRCRVNVSMRQCLLSSNRVS